MSILSAINQQYANKNKTDSYSLLTANQRLTAASRDEERKKSSQDSGGFFGGLGYLFEKVGLGALNSVEGIWDYTAGGIAKLLGNDDWAEQQFANDWVNYNHADEWYNPSGGWKVAGDVAGSIGNSALNMAVLVGVGAATGGAAVPAMAATFLTSGLSAAGNATKEAYQKTGQLGGKEFGYGALSGVTEGAVETFSDAVLGGVGGKVTKAFRKDAVSSAVRKTLGREVVESFLSEGMEEVVGGLADPLWQRMTIDKNAQWNASDIAYAGLVGGLSGAIMSGVGNTFIGSKSRLSSLKNGTSIAARNESQTVLDESNHLLNYEAKNQTGSEVYENIQATLKTLNDSLASTDGQVKTMKQKMLLGELQRLNGVAVFQAPVVASAENIYNNAETIAERINQYGYKDSNGKPIQITAEQLRNGIETGDGKAFRKSFVNALKSNSALRTLAVMDAAGQMQMDTAKFKEATLQGSKIASQIDINQFIERGTAEEKAQLGEKLGIQNWNTVTAEELGSKIGNFIYDGGVQQYQQERAEIKNLQQLDAKQVKQLPKTLNLKEDSAVRYSLGEADVAIVKKGDTYKIYDYKSDKISKALSKSEFNNVIQKITTAKEEAQTARENSERENAEKQAKEIDDYCRENIKDYKKLGAANQSMIRSVIRQGRAAGVDESFLLTTARVSARSGLNVIFSEELSFVKQNGTYADGAIDLKNNRIIINPKAKTRTGEMILIHELTHAIYNQDGMLNVADGIALMSQEEKNRIIERYRSIGRGGAIELSDELNAHFAEQTLANKNILERLWTDEPSIKKRILGFFKGSKNDYKSDTRLSDSAARLFKQYKKLFDEFANRNQYSNANESSKPSGDGRFALDKNGKNIYNKSEVVNGKQERLRETSGRTSSETLETAVRPNEQKHPSVDEISRRFSNMLTGECLRAVSEKYGLEDNQAALKEYRTAIINNSLADNSTVNINGEMHELSIIKPEYRARQLKDIFAENNEFGVETCFYVNDKTNPYMYGVYQQDNDIIYLRVSEQDADFVNHNKHEKLHYFATKYPHCYQQFIKAIEKVTTKAERVMLYNKYENRYKNSYAGFDANGFRDAIWQEVYANIYQQTNADIKVIKNRDGVYQAIDDFETYLKKQFKLGHDIQYALPDTDSNGNKLSDAQREFFANSKAVDESGHLLKLYHNSPKDFFVFDKSKIGSVTDYGVFGRGFYFGDEEWKNYGGNKYEVYLNLQNPLILDTKEKVLKFRENMAQYSGKDYYEDNLNEDDAEKFTEKLKSDGFDGVIVKTKSYNKLGKNEYIAFEPSQIKYITNQNPTNNPDIRYALPETDSAGKKLTDAQREYFKNSKVIDDNGHLLNVYHGTKKDFNIFDINKSSPGNTLGDGFYFTVSEDEARQKYAGENGVVIETYLNMKNPLYVDLVHPTEIINKLQQSFDKDFADGKIDKTFDVRKSLEDWRYNRGVNRKKLVKLVKQQGYDGIVNKYKGYYVVFDSNQAKRVSNLNPTVDADMRYALPEVDSRGRKLSRPQLDYFNDSKVVDKDGKLLPVYHGTPFDFTEFKLKDTNCIPIYGKGHYFTNKRSTAKMYAGKTGNIHRVYLNIKNPYYANRSDEYSLNSDKLQKQGYDGVIREFGDESYYVVFESNQIKNVNNNNPTIGNDIRYAIPSEDSDGSALSQEQQKYFQSSMLLDDSGRLLKTYHGTPNGEFTIFDRKKIGSNTDAGFYGSGFYFSSHKNQANIYNTGDNGRVLECYLLVKKPLFMNGLTKSDLAKLLDVDEDIFVTQPNGIVKPSFKYLDTFTSHLSYQGYDGVVVKYDKSDEIVVFDSNQIKLTSNKKPTSNPDIRYAIPNDDYSGKKLTAEQQEFYKNSAIKAVEGEYGIPSIVKDGKLLPLYHGTNTGEFFEFDEKWIGSSNDSGWFGKGFYFAFSRGEAKTYGSRVLECYLNIKNPFDFDGELKGYKAQDHSGTLGRCADFMINLSKKLPEISKTIDFEYVDKNDSTGECKKISLDKLADSIKAIYSDDRLTLSPVSGYFDDGKIAYYWKYKAKDIKDINVSKELQKQLREFAIIEPYYVEMKHDMGKISDTLFEEYNQYIKKFGADDFTDVKLGNVYFETKEDANKYRLNAAYEYVKSRYSYLENRSIVDMISSRSGLFTDTLKAKGYDGILQSKRGDEVVAFYPNQIKLTSNTAPTESNDMRYALSSYSKGQHSKFAANNTRLKVYSKQDAASVIESIIDERLELRDKYGVMSNKNKAAVIDELFVKLNNTKSGYRSQVALDIADYIINNAVLQDINADFNVDSGAAYELAYLRGAMHNVDLSGIKAEIGDRKGLYRVWGKKDGSYRPDTLALEHQESYGYQYHSQNEADQFFEMVDRYHYLRDSVNKKIDETLIKDYFRNDQQGLEELRQQIAKDVLNAYDTKGSPSKFSKLVDKYTTQINNLRKQVKEERFGNKLVNNIIDTAQYLRDIANKRSYVGAEVFNAPELTAWLKELGKLKYRSDIRKAGARQLLLNYGKFYNRDNPLLNEYSNGDNLSQFNYIDQNVLDAIDFIKENADSNKPLSLEELQAAQVIMASAKHLYQNYDQMLLNGKKVRVSETAVKAIEIVKQTKAHVGKGWRNTFFSISNKIIEPRAVLKGLESYAPDGILNAMYQDITNGETAANLMYIDLMNGYDNFFKVNKKYNKRLTSEYVKVGDAELSVGQAISLYETSKREQAKAGLYESGYSYMDKRGVKQTAKLTKENIEELSQQFTDADREFIRITEEFFNVKSKKAKTDADIEILGYTNASEDFYFPIKRDGGTIARNVTDARSMAADWANVYNFSFNKNVKEGAKNKLFISSVYDVVTRHARQLSTYANLTVPLKNFSQVYVKNTGTKTDIQTLKNVLSERIWDKADKYLTKLFADIQGRATSNSVIEKLRGNFAKSQLGANLKVIVSQVTSYPTAGIMLDAGCMAKAITMKTNTAAMDKYCPYAKVRNYERGVVKAEGVIDKVGKIGDVLTKPIQWTDRLTIGKLWNASQLQVQKEQGLKVGTEENMKAAGVLLEEVIRNTQPNYSNTERSELMRTDSDIVRAFTMFTSVPLKQLSRLVESWGEFKSLHQQVKAGNASSEVTARYKAAKRKLGRTLGAITIANMMYVMVAQFFKWLYRKDRKDKDGNKISISQDMFNDFVSTTIGMLPVVKDIYGYFTNGYEIENFFSDTLNTVLSSSQELFNLATKAGSGEDISNVDLMRSLRNSMYAVGQVSGIPTRNINNLVSGLLNRFSPSTAYKYNSMFYNARYSSDIKNALESGDYELADTVMTLLLDKNGVGSLSDNARKKLINLYEKEYNVLPRSVGNTVTYNGETITLTSTQKKKFKSIYSSANSYIEKMMTNKAFGKLSEEEQAKAIKQIYDASYDRALAETLNVGTTSKMGFLSNFVSLDKLSPLWTSISDMSTDKDKNGNSVAGSKKKKLITYLTNQNLSDGQCLLMLYAQGYTIQDGDYKRMTKTRARKVLLQYILSARVSQAEKIKAATMCGFTVKNNKIMVNSI